jgi:uncharacterized protein
LKLLGRQITMVILYWVLFAVMLVGIVGAFVPGIPGPTIILAAILIWGVASHYFLALPWLAAFGAIAWPLGIAIAILVIGIGVDLMASQWGAKKAGASNWGVWGAVIGMILGFLGFLPTVPIGGPIGLILGLMLGPLLGAIVGEFLFTKDLQKSIKAGIGIVVGSVVGNVIQGVLAIAPVVAFVWTTWPLLNIAP